MSAEQTVFRQGRQDPKYCPGFVLNSRKRLAQKGGQGVTFRISRVKFCFGTPPPRHPNFYFLRIFLSSFFSHLLLIYPFYCSSVHLPLFCVFHSRFTLLLSSLNIPSPDDIRKFSSPARPPPLTMDIFVTFKILLHVSGKNKTEFVSF